MNIEISKYINKQVSPQKEICQQLRALVLKTFPQSTEEIKWSVPAFAGGKFYIVALKDHVNLGFSSKRLTKKELALFDGGGKTMRHIHVEQLTDLDEKRIVTLLKLVDKKTKT